ncbi:MAG: hypothetical protein DI527_05055 [Chelatococcus sp.]|nr:MAG: hypothetical protein DI527_05055 [Chelatococcus sp.]
MAANRLKAIERMLAIQSRIRALAEWRKLALERQASQARDETRVLISALAGGGGPVDGLFAEFTAKRLHRVSLSLWELDHAAREQAARLAGEVAREKRTARLADRVRRIKLRADEDGALREVMDAVEARRAASLE